MAVKPNIDDYKFTDYRNPDAFFGGEMPERGTYRKALKSVADEIEQQAQVVKKTYWGNTPAAKQFRTELDNIWGHSSVRDTLSPTANSQLEDQPELLQAVNDVRQYGRNLLKELEPLTQWNGKEWIEPVNESIIDKLGKAIYEAENEGGKFFYIIGEAEESTSYYDSDTHMYFPDSRTLDNGYFPKERYNTLQEVVDAILEDGYYSIDEKIDFPSDVDYLEDLPEWYEQNKDDMTVNENKNYIELFSYWCTKMEEFGPEYHEYEAEVSRLIEICKEK